MLWAFLVCAFLLWAFLATAPA